MNFVAIPIIIGGVAILSSICFLLIGWKRIPWFDYTLAMLLTLMLLFFISNYLEIKGIDLFDPYESFFLPMIWSFFFYTNDIKMNVLDRNKIQNDLKDSNQRFELMTNTIQDMFWLESPDLQRSIFVSTGYNTVFGHQCPVFSEKKNAAHNWIEVIPNDERLQYLQKIRESIADGKSYKLEYRICKDNNIRWILERGYPVKNQTGDIEMIAGVCSDISDRKNAEIALQKSEEKLRIILSSIGDAVITTNIEGRVEWLNKTAEKMTGWTLIQAQGKMLPEVFKITQAKNYGVEVNLVQNVIKTGEIVNLKPDAILIDRFGNKYHIADSAAPIKDEQGNIRGIAMSFTDITENYLLQEEIRNSKERLELAISAAQLGTWDWDILGGKVIYNERWASMLGYSLDEIRPDITYWEDLVHPDDFSQMINKLTDHINGITDLYESEHRLRSKTGDWVWVLAKGKVIQRDIDGQPLRACGTHLDITSRKKDQQEMKQYLDKITEQNQFIQKIFNASPNIIYVFDTHQKAIFYHNYRISEITGYTEEQIEKLGGQFFAKVMHPQDIPKLMEHLKKMKVAADNQIIQFEYRIKDSKGNWRWALSYDTPFQRESNGMVSQIVGIAIDVTQQKESRQKFIMQQQHLSKMNEELQSVNKNLDLANSHLKELDLLKNEFIATASHELRTPVTSILGFSQTLLAPGLNINESKRYDFLRIIEKESIRLSKLITDLLNISNIESGFTVLEMKCISIGNLARDAVASMHPFFKKKITIINEEAEKKQVYCNRDQIFEVFVNIIDNGLRYGDEVTIKIAQEQSNVLVSIHDNGPGIAEHYLKVIFEKFYRIQGEKKPGKGSGLGLAIAKDIITAHGGKIWAESTPGNGTTLFFTLKKC